MPIATAPVETFNIGDPVGVLVFVNLRAASCRRQWRIGFYLKGVAPKHGANQIFAGMMPMVEVLCRPPYVWPGMTLWLPNYLYGR